MGIYRSGQSPEMIDSKWDQVPCDDDDGVDAVPENFEDELDMRDLKI